MVSAWGCKQRLVLAQIATDAKSNEITAVPKLLRMLSLKSLPRRRPIGAKDFLHRGIR